MPVAEKKMVDLVGTDQMCRSADAEYFASELVTELDRRPNPKVVISDADNDAAGWIREPMKIDVRPVNDPNVLGDRSKGEHREHLRTARQ
jgi:hypothetical protein